MTVVCDVLSCAILEQFGHFCFRELISTFGFKSYQTPLLCEIKEAQTFPHFDTDKRFGDFFFGSFEQSQSATDEQCLHMLMMPVTDGGQYIQHMATIVK